MKQLELFLSIFISSQLLAQDSEFKVYNNGLIYETATMSKLGQIVDSLNLKYKSCELDRVLMSKCQTIGHVILLKDGKIRDAKKAIEEGISFEAFLAKYPKAEIDSNVPIVKFDYQSGDKNYTEINAIIAGNEIHKTVEEIAKIGNFKGKWVTDYSSKSEYSKERLEAFYFVADFETTPLPEKYAQKVGYTNCLIDTTSQKFKETADYNNFNFPISWESLSVKEKEDLLDTMRNTKVRGYCSMDNRPRTHAVNIALLSAETTNWEVFLRAHLDIMNDRFERVSDGSYAWTARKTYLRELEELDINVIDLIMGISFRIENPVKNHYYGNIGRLGRAISESEQKDFFIKELCSTIEDPKLDNFNRIIAYWLFQSMISWTDDENLKTTYAKTLDATINSFPKEIQEQLKAQN